MTNILTASKWLKQNYPNATGWHEDYTKEYAEYYAKEMVLKFHEWLSKTYVNCGGNSWALRFSFGHPRYIRINDLYNQFLTEQNQTDARTESN